MTIRLFKIAAMAAALLFCTRAISSALTFTPGSGPPTAKTSVSGTGFTPNSIVDVYFDLTQLAFKLTDAAGKFSMQLSVPSSARPGEHTVTVIPHFGTGAVAQNAFIVQTNWLQWRGDAAGRGWNRTENVLNSGMVQDLDLTNILASPIGVLSTPVIVNNFIYFVSSDGHLRKFSRLTFASSFDVDTSADGLTSPSYGAGLIFVAGRGKLYARSTANGALVWQANLPPVVGTPVFSGNVVYVVAAGDANAGLYAFSATCGSRGATCAPLWRGASAMTGIYPVGSLAVSNGYVYAKMDYTLYQFKIGCQTGGALCSPFSSRASVQSLSPAVANNYVYVVYKDSSNNNILAALRANCIGCDLAWTYQLPADAYGKSVAVGGNKVFIEGANLLYAFPAACGATTCNPLWTTPLVGGNYSPTIAGDLVFAPSPNDLIAFPVNCYPACPGFWHGGAGGFYGNSAYAAVAVADGVVYSPGYDGLHVYQLISARRAARSLDRINPANLKPSPLFAEAAQRLAEQLGLGQASR